MGCPCTCFCFYVGLIYILNFLYQALKHTFIYVFPKKQDEDWLTRFGKGSYVLITGCTSGIGLKFTELIASRGFNLILWSRSLTKLEKLRNSLGAQYPSADIRIIAKDFTQSCENDFFETALEPVKDLDVSILINNVGVTFPKVDFADADPQDIVDNININMIPQSVLNSKFIKKLQDRENESGIIDLASTAGCAPFPLAKIYGASKCFNRYFTFGLSNYFSTDKLTFLSVNPGPVSTYMMRILSKDLYAKISSVIDRGFSLAIVDTHQCVTGVLRSFGKHPWTGGAIVHSWLYLVLETLNDFSLMLDPVIFIGKKVARMIKK